MFLWDQGYPSHSSQKAAESQRGWTMTLPEAQGWLDSRDEGSISVPLICGHGPPSLVESISQTEIIPGDLGSDNQHK